MTKERTDRVQSFNEQLRIPSKVCVKDVGGNVGKHSRSLNNYEWQANGRRGGYHSQSFNNWEWVAISDQLIFKYIYRVELAYT